MKKICTVLLLFMYMIGIVACGKQDVSKDATSTNENVDKNTLQKEEKSWSEQEITDMFYSMMNGKIELEYLDCTIMSDRASDHIGAILFKNTEDGTTNIAFFDEEGYAQQCGIYAKVADVPDLTYLGNGTVTFKLETDEHIIYNCTITISVDGGNVAFVMTDDLKK